MFHAHALREGRGHARTQTWRPLPDLLKIDPAFFAMLSGQFFFRLMCGSLEKEKRIVIGCFLISWFWRAQLFLWTFLVLIDTVGWVLIASIY